MISCSYFYLVASVLAFSIDRDSHVAGTQVSRIRGTPISKNSLYDPERDFECLDGTKTMPFDRVNDDYCDCPDGSDEPGTSACPNGVFFCQNTGHRAKYLPSGFVNDGVCDCCDASDEWSSGVRCTDNCHHLGREARLEAEKAAELEKEGNKIRMELLALGKSLKTDNQAKLNRLRSDFEEAALVKKEKEATKNQAEERETAALEKYKVEEPEAPAAEETEEKRTLGVEDYFKYLDSDNSGSVCVRELQVRITFDKNGDGEVSEDEARFFLNNKDEINYEDFVDLAWPNIKPFVMKEQGAFVPPASADSKDASRIDAESPDHSDEDDAEADHDEDHHDQDDQEKSSDDDEKLSDDQEKHDTDKDPEVPQVQYDEETQALIDEANQARERYRESEKSFDELQREIRILEEKIDRDYGNDEEFASMDGECYEHRDLEYVYSLCMYGRATQRSIAGGAEVNLGQWNEWTGPATNKYSRMKYDRGLTCWNGPARNTVVNLRCGKENELLSVKEPNRCEYTMEFATPALCNPNVEPSHVHDEM